jgi:hypothetical protein
LDTRVLEDCVVSIFREISLQTEKLHGATAQKTMNSMTMKFRNVAAN